MSGQHVASAEPAQGTRSACGRYWYDKATADAAVSFFGLYLRLTDAEWAGRPFVLASWQEHDIIRPLFGWKRDDGTRRYRRAIVWIPRKNGKTELAAGVALLALVFDAEPGGQVYAMAADEKQARIVFDKAAVMVAMSPELSKVIDCFKPSIYCAQLNAAFKPLSGRPQGKHGLSASGLIGDEVHEWKTSDLYTFVHQSTAARRQPIEFLISTAGTREGYGFELAQYCDRVQAGDIDDSETLIVSYAADPDDDWTDPAIWAKANPNLGVSVKVEYLASECEKAKASPRLENDFKRYHLNIWTEQAVRWISLDKWGPVGTAWRDPDFEAELEGCPCFGGIDLSSTRDLTAWSLLFPPHGTRTKWRKLTRAFVPEETIAARVKSDGVPYDRWLRDGAIFATPGNVVDYDFLKAQIFADAARFRIQSIGYDPWVATQIALQLRGEGLETFEVRQGFASLSIPAKEFERMVLAEEIDHGGHPVARWCVGNVAVETDAAENIKPSKKKSTERIDVVAADINALAVALAGQDEKPAPDIVFL